MSWLEILIPLLKNYYYYNYFSVVSVYALEVFTLHLRTGPRLASELVVMSQIMQ